MPISCHLYCLSLRSRQHYGLPGEAHDYARGLHEIKQEVPRFQSWSCSSFKRSNPVTTPMTVCAQDTHLGVGGLAADVREGAGARQRRPCRPPCLLAAVVVVVIADLQTVTGRNKLWVKMLVSRVDIAWYNVYNG